MARDLAASSENKIKIFDKLSGSELIVKYRMPTTEERIEFKRKCIKRRGSKVADNSAEALLEIGPRLITGFGDGDFEIDGKPISSDPLSNNYYPDWKTLLVEQASDIVMYAAQTIFDSVSGNKTEIQFVDEITEAAGSDSGEAKNELPLGQS